MIFITGGTGMTGARLLYDLALQNRPVTALKRPLSSLKIVDYYFERQPELRKYITWTDGDITDRQSLEIIENGAEVYHCAGMVSFDPADRSQLYLINIRGTENIVNVCLEKNVKKLVYVSSVATLGRNSVDSVLIDENVHWENSSHNSDYSISKYGGEREVWRGIAEGLNAVIVNPSVIIGPGKWNDGSMRLISRMDEGLKFYTDGISGFVDVKDVSAVMIKLMKSDVQGERYILNSENISYLELFTIIADAIHKTPPSIKGKKWMGEIMWRVEWLKKKLTGTPQMITRYSAATAFRKYHYDSSRIIKLLNHHFIPLKESIAEAGKVYLLQKSLTRKA
jgi:dihydroflavonol-4-reductase